MAATSRSAVGPNDPPTASRASRNKSRVMYHFRPFAMPRRDRPAAVRRRAPAAPVAAAARRTRTPSDVRPPDAGSARRSPRARRSPPTGTTRRARSRARSGAAAADRRHPGIHLTRRGDPFTTLARAIVGQQISVKAAQTIWDRFAVAAAPARDGDARRRASTPRARRPDAPADAAPLRPVGAQGRVPARSRAPFRDRRARSARMAGARRRGADRAAGRRQGHRPLDRRDVPHLPRAARRRSSASTTSACSARSRCTTTAASGSTPAAMRELGARGSRSAASRRGTCGARSTPCRSSTECAGTPRDDRSPHHRTPASRPTACSMRSTSVGLRRRRPAAGARTATRTASTRSASRMRPPVVAKFYRPRALDRRADPRGARVRRRARRARDPGRRRRSRATERRCTRSAASASPCIRNAAAARPSSKTARRSNGWAASSAASMRSARKRRSAHRPALDVETLRRGAARLPARARLHPAGPASTRGAASPRRRSTACARCFDRAGDVRHAAPARRLPRRQRAVDRRRPALRRLRRRADGPRGAGPVDAALRRARRDDAPARRRARGLRAISATSIRASCTWSKRCARCASSTTRRGSRGAGTIRRFPPRSRGSTPSATGRTASWSCASRSR